MINIRMDEFMEWFQRKINIKYSFKLESLQRSFIIFHNLADQVISLYQIIRQKMEKYSDKEEYKDILALLNRSLILMSKITENFPICLDSHFCERFIKTFDFNINLLCTYYHSLNHFEIINKETKFEKDKIVEGINKLYSIHIAIKEGVKQNINIIKILNLVSDYKRIFTMKINSINAKIINRSEKKEQFMENFELQAAEFYEFLEEKIKSVSNEPDAKRSLMKAYFQLLHQLYESQAHLEILMENIIKTSAEIRGRKKNISYVGQESCTQFTRWITIILKPNISTKNIKKIKVDEFIKVVHSILQEKDTFNQFYFKEFQMNEEEISNLLTLILDISRQFEKIEQSGILGIISEYKDNLMPGGSRKFIHRMTEYQQEMNKFYLFHEEVKQLQKYAQTIVLDELDQKVNIIVEESEHEN